MFSHKVIFENYVFLADGSGSFLILTLPGITGTGRIGIGRMIRGLESIKPLKRHGAVVRCIKLTLQMSITIIKAGTQRARAAERRVNGSNRFDIATGYSRFLRACTLLQLLLLPSSIRPLIPIPPRPRLITIDLSAAVHQPINGAALLWSAAGQRQSTYNHT